MVRLWRPPSAGDIGVVARPIGCAGAVNTGSGWALKLPRGLVTRRPRVMAAWGWP
jgi:hypothetical protein